MSLLDVHALFNTSTTRLCFMATITLGVAFLFVGLVLIPISPYFQLDVVLTPDELDDAELRTKTLALLAKASGRQWLLWTIGGAAQIVIGAIGLRTCQPDRKSENSSIPQFPSE